MKKWPISKYRETECDVVREMLSPYIDGELNPNELHTVELHLRSCQACRKEYDSLRETVSIIRHMPAVESKRSFFINETPQRKTNGKLKALYISTTVAMVFLVFVLIGDVSHFFDVSPSTAPPQHGPSQVSQHFWPVREVEFGLIGVLSILGVITFIYWRRRVRGSRYRK